MQPHTVRSSVNTMNLSLFLLRPYFVLDLKYLAPHTKYDPPPPPTHTHSGWHTAVARMKGQRSNLLRQIRRIPTHATRVIYEPVRTRAARPGETGVRGARPGSGLRIPGGSPGFLRDSCGDPLAGWECVSADQIRADTWR